MDDVGSPSLAPRKKARTVPTPRVVHGDCVQHMKTLKDSSARLVLADPPYGVGSATWDGSDGYMGFARAWLSEAARVLQAGGTLIYFASPCTIWSSRINVMLEDELGLKHQQTMTWIYSQGGDARLESMKQYAVRSETIEWWTKPPGLPTFNPALAAERYSEEDKKVALAKGIGRVSAESLDKGRPPRTWCDIPRENSRSKERQYGKHPSMKPLMLCERLINVHSNSADCVIIPFAGSGSEVLQAAKLGREVIGFETQDEYITLMRARFEGHSVDVAFE
jgi:DNA modification methylase